MVQFLGERHDTLKEGGHHRPSKKSCVFQHIHDGLKGTRDSFTDLIKNQSIGVA